jgi:hypothetical protein
MGSGKQFTEEWSDMSGATPHDVQSLRDRFKRLHSTKKPTGDQTCPPDVQCAKIIYESIKDKMEFSDGEGAWWPVRNRVHYA